MQHPSDVRVDERSAALVRERRDGSGGVVTDARQGAQRGRIIGDRPTIARHVSGEGVEVSGARVIAETRPGLQHAVRRRFGHVSERGETREESLVVVHHPRYLRLLQHELGDEHAVRVASPSPRQVAAVLTEPRAKAP